MLAGRSPAQAQRRSRRRRSQHKPSAARGSGFVFAFGFGGARLRRGRRLASCVRPPRSPPPRGGVRRRSRALRARLHEAGLSWAKNLKFWRSCRARRGGPRRRRPVRAIARRRRGRGRSISPAGSPKTTPRQLAERMTAARRGRGLPPHHRDARRALDRSRRRAPRRRALLRLPARRLQGPPRRDRRRAWRPRRARN